MSVLKKLFRNFLLVSILSLVLGIALIANPAFFTKAISYAIGGISAGVGVIYIIRFVTKSEDKDASGYLLFRGIVLCAVAIFLFLKPDFIFQVIAIFFGLYLLFNGILRLVDSFTFKRSNDSWILSFVLSMLTVILGVFVLVNPLFAKDVAVQVLGIALTCSAVVNLVCSFDGRRHLKKLEKAVDSATRSKKDDFIDI